MSKDKQFIFPNPERQINVLKRYLHILALLQHTPEGSETWNARKLADLISRDQGMEDIDDSQVRKYIKQHIEEELGIEIDRSQGKPSMALAEDIDTEMQLTIARVYADFVIKDTTRDNILKKFIETMPDKALWTLARIYFAVIEKRMLKINYTTNTGGIISGWEICPYYLIFRNNNLYLSAFDPKKKNSLSLIASRIKNISVLEKSSSVEWEIPPVEELFHDSLSAYVSNKKDSVLMKIRYHQEIANSIDQVIGILEPETTQTDSEHYESVIHISDYLYLCKQLVLYGNKVEVISPPLVRDTMIKMLKESLSVYDMD